MWEFIIDNLGQIVIGGGVGIAVIVGMIQRVRERKYHMNESEDKDVLGTAGKIMGNTIYHGMPTDITGMPPTGHFQKPDFSCDEEDEATYYEKYESKERRQ